MELIRGLSVHRNRVLSLDMLNLFHSDYALTVFRKRFKSDLVECANVLINTLMKILTFSVQTTTSIKKSDIYQQEEGMTMTPPLSPVMVNIYMKRFKTLKLYHLNSPHG